MRKILTLFAVVFLISFKLNGQTMWQGFPITVTQVNLNATDSYLRYSVYDTLLNATVVDSTPVYNFNFFYASSGPLLTYTLDTPPFSDHRHYIFYNHNIGAFRTDSIHSTQYLLNQSSSCFSPAIIYGNYFLDYDCAGGSHEVYFLVYANIITNSFDYHYYTYDEGFGFGAGLEEGWFYDSEGGAQGIVLNYQSAKNVQPGMSGFYGSVSVGNNMGIDFVDGIAVVDVVDQGNTYFTYGSNDGCSAVSLVNPVVNGTNNGIVWYSDSVNMNVASDDAIMDQWIQAYFPKPYLNGKSIVRLKDRVFVFASNKDTIANVYCAAYNFPQHAWVVDSVLSNRVNNLAINNGTITWSDSAGTNFMRGYADTIGWGNFTTPLQIEFSLENLQSPTNGNLVYVRNYTIGSDSTQFDFGDGYVTNRKSDSHLYRNPNGTYRTTSNFTQDVCLNALGQSSCKQVTFVTTTHNLATVNPEISIGYSDEKGVFVLSNKTNKDIVVKIYNLMGQPINSFSVNSPTHKFNLVNKANGIYVAHIKSTDNTFKKSIKLVNGR